MSVNVTSTEDNFRSLNSNLVMISVLSENIPYKQEFLINYYLTPEVYILG